MREVGGERARAGLVFADAQGREQGVETYLAFQGLVAAIGVCREVATVEARREVDAIEIVFAISQGFYVNCRAQVGGWREEVGAAAVGRYRAGEMMHGLVFQEVGYWQSARLDVGVVGHAFHVEGQRAPDGAATLRGRELRGYPLAIQLHVAAQADAARYVDVRRDALRQQRRDKG